MKITILTTGGTIEKTYNEFEGALYNYESVLDNILSSLRLPDLFIRHIAVMKKDSLEMTSEDRRQIIKEIKAAEPTSEGIIVLHGTDTLSVTGDFLFDNLKDVSIPIILTGAMRPYEFKDTDALQNVTESLLAVRMLKPGIYTVMHNKVLEFPGVLKDKQSLTFRTKSEMESINSDD